MERGKGGESIYSVSTADGYIEYEPTVKEWVQDHIPTRHQVLDYFLGIFPWIKWVPFYNFTWFIGDLIAGITVGAVVVPQGMAYAKLAALPVQYGLYSSFMGVALYWLFATSKDITIGPVAVLSTLTGNIVLEVQAKHKDLKPAEIAQALAIIAGSIVTLLGFTRLGFLVELIPLTAIAAFMTGSAINIAVGQVPGLMGITGFNTRAPTYWVIINTLKGLPHTKLDAAIGLTALTLLYLIRIACSIGQKRLPSRQKWFFYAATLRTAFVILLYTLIGWLVNRHHKKNPKFAILGTVPRGFTAAGVPRVDKELVTSFATKLPAVVIVMLIEHISISKSFGRINNYTINPSQELIAMGITNLFGPFVGAYPATGSFSRTAIKAKAGVRTPFAGIITAIVVLLAIYALTAVFYYIPNAALSAVIIHAVGDLITSPRTLYKFWRISPIELPIWAAGVLVTVFSSIENGIYVTISVSAGLMLFRILKAQGRFLGKVKIHSVLGDAPDTVNKGSASPTPLNTSEDGREYRTTFLPIDHQDGTNPAVEVQTPYDGIFIFRFSDGFFYPNASHYFDYLTRYIFAHTRRTDPNHYARLGDRPWNDPGTSRGTPTIDTHLPTLKAVILDFSTVNNVDVTAVQNLIDVRNQLDRYASPDNVEWHFAAINSRWAKRALASAGFGYPSSQTPGTEGGARPLKAIFSVAEVGGDDSAAKAAELQEERNNAAEAKDVEAVGHGIDTNHTNGSGRIAAVHGINLPLFHTDLIGAVQAALVSTHGKVVPV